NLIVIHQQRICGKTSKDIYSHLFGFLPKPAHHFANGGYIIAMILHGWRSGYAKSGPFSHKIYFFRIYFFSKRKVFDLFIWEKCFKSNRIDDRPRQAVTT